MGKKKNPTKMSLLPLLNFKMMPTAGASFYWPQSVNGPGAFFFFFSYKISHKLSALKSRTEGKWLFNKGGAL